MLAALCSAASALPITPSAVDARHAGAAASTDAAATHPDAGGAASTDAVKPASDAVAERQQSAPTDDAVQYDDKDNPWPVAAGPLPRSGDHETSPKQDFVDGRDETLEQMLRSVVTVEQGDQPLARSRFSGTGGDARGDGGSIGLSGIILDSETPAILLREVIDIKSTDGRVTVFSVLGLGDFVLEVAPGDHAWTISELSTDWSMSSFSGSVTVASSESAESSNLDAAGRDAGAVPHRTIGVLQLLRWAREFLISPTGFLSTLLGTLFALLWVAARTLVALERRSWGRRGY